MDDPFNRNLMAAGAISFSQEEILRRSFFVSYGSHSSSSSSSSGSGPGGAPCWISHRTVTMRSASDSHHSSSSSSSSSDARGCGGREVAQSPGAEENLDGGDGGEGSGLPGNRGDRIAERMKGKKKCALKRKGSSAGRMEKRSRPLSEESKPEESPVVSPRGTVVSPRGGMTGKKKCVLKRKGKRLVSSRSGKEAVETERADGDSGTEPRGVEDEGGDRSANDEFARFRYVRTCVPPLLHSPPPELLKDALGSPKSAQGGARSPPQQRSQVAREPEEGPPPPAMGMDTSSPVEIPQQPEGLRAVEKSPSGDAQSLASPTETVTGDQDMGICCSSDLVDLLIKFSKKSDKRLENVDFLDVLEMKGIHIPPPSWWRPGGYGPKTVLTLAKAAPVECTGRTEGRE